MGDFFPTRFVTNNPLPIDGSAGRAPQQLHAIPRFPSDDELRFQIGQTLSGTWSIFSGSWLRYALSAQPFNVFFNGKSGEFKGSNFTLVTANYQWAWSGGFVYIRYPGGTAVASDIYGGPLTLYFKNPKGGTDRHSTKNLKPLRIIRHPGYGLTVVYPKNPDRTTNYMHSAVRKYDIEQIETLHSSINVLDLQRWEGVTISEQWDGAEGSVLSMMLTFFETLHMFRATPPPLGQWVSWCPFDLSFDRHLIQPISLTLGGQEINVREIRERYESGLSAYIDQTVVFSFKLVRAVPPVDSLLRAEGA